MNFGLRRVIFEPKGALTYLDPSTARPTGDGKVRMTNDGRIPRSHKLLILSVDKMTVGQYIKVPCALRYRTSLHHILSYHFRNSRLVLKSYWYEDHVFIFCIGYRKSLPPPFKGTPTQRVLPGQGLVPAKRGRGRPPTRSASTVNAGHPFARTPGQVGE